MVTPLIKLPLLSKKYKCRLFAKLEYMHPTKTHKDRASLLFIKDAIKKKFNKVGIASTGNAGISLLYHASLYSLKSYVFVEKNLSYENLKFLTSFNAKIIRASNYEKCYYLSNKYFKKNNIYNSNPGTNKLSYKAYYPISKEISSKIRPDILICPINNGSLISGIVEGFKSKNKEIQFICTSSKNSVINHSLRGLHLFERTVLEKIQKTLKLEIIDITDNETINAMNTLMKNENIFLETSSATTLAALEKLNIKNKNVCLILTGSGIRHPPFKFPKVKNE